MVKVTNKDYAILVKKIDDIGMMVAELTLEKRKNCVSPAIDEKQSITKSKGSNKKPIGAKVIEIIKEKMGEVSPEGQKVVRQEIDSYLKENGLGILILSRFDEKGETIVKLDSFRTHEKHVKDTFKKLFENSPKLKNDILELLNEEQNTAEKDKEILIKMVR